ncbi:hypothetical protein [Treponema sp.]|uniref:hypothetical protein n=1 Tax=Treponema sp. TaxID=166 RepID=UPI0038904470
MKRLPTKKAFMLFYAFDIVLLIIVAVFLLPFSKNRNVQESIKTALLDSALEKEITEIRIVDRQKKYGITMYRMDDRWIGTDTESNNTLYWPVNQQTMERFFKAVTTENIWTKKASNVTSWEKLGVDTENAVEVDLRIDAKTAGAFFFGFMDDLTGDRFFRTSKESTVWSSQSSVENFIFGMLANNWADPYLVPPCISGMSPKDSESYLRRGELAYIKPGDHIQPIKTFKKYFESGNHAVYSFYEKDDQIVVIPEFYGDEYLRLLSYRYTISRWTYDKFIKELDK